MFIKDCRFILLWTARYEINSFFQLNLNLHLVLKRAILLLAVWVEFSHWLLCVNYWTSEKGAIERHGLGKTDVYLQRLD